MRKGAEVFATYGRGVEKSKRQRWRRVLGLNDGTPRRDEKSAEVIDKQRVVRPAVTEKSAQTSEKKGLE